MVSFWLLKSLNKKNISLSLAVCAPLQRFRQQHIHISHLRDLFEMAENGSEVIKLSSSD